MKNLTAKRFWKGRIALLSNNNPPTMYRNRRYFIKYIALALITEYTKKKIKIYIMIYM